MAPAPPRKAAATIELSVETLTGAGFRLRVSSFETVMSVKARIQRIEGVPISQQHLIHRDRELSDSATLRESGVTSGAKLKLVVAMRGGPVNTRRLPMYEDFTHAEMQQLMELQSEAGWEEEAGRQVTLLVFREGDQVNFYRVMENTDGTFSPLSDSWGTSLRNMFHEENPEEVKRRLDENSATMDKVMELRRRMQQAAQRKRGRARPVSKPGRQSASTAASARVRLPPVSTTVRPSPSLPSSIPNNDLSESFSRLAAGGATSASRGRRHAAPPSQPPQTLADAVAAARASSAASDLNEERQQLASRGTVTSARQMTSARRRKLSLSESTELFRQLQSQRGLDRHTVTTPSTPRHDYGAYRRTLTRLTRHQKPSAESPSSTAAAAVAGAETAAAELPVLFESDERRVPVPAAAVPAPRRVPRSAGSRPRTSPSQQYSKDDSDRPRSPALSLLPTDGRARQLCRILSARAALPSGGKTKQADKPAAPPAVSRRTKRERCQHCRRRLGLASVYRCHCSGVFCTQHRYPELHHCGYDFKTEGRKLIERANPLITAPKLPKI